MGGTSQAVLDGQADNQLDSLGYYYAITGGKFPNGQTVTGESASGGTFRYLVDDPDWGYPTGVWNKDGWFPENAGLALTMKNQGTVIYDNFNNDAGDFYTTPDGQATGDTPGMYRGYCMSNNWDFIYAGYLKLTEETTIDQIMGYFDENAGFDADNPLVSFRMNIWSNLEGDLLPAVADFTGDVFSSDNTAGTFTWEDTGVDRIFGDDYGNITDDIMLLTYTLDTPITLAAGEYWFSHDAIIPEPATMALLALGGLLLRRKK